MKRHHWLRLSGVALAASYVGALFTASLPEGAYDDARVVGLLAGGDRTGIVVGGYALVVAGVSALVFWSLLASSLSPHTGAGASVVRTLGTAYGVLLMVAAVLFLAVPMGHVVEELPRATPSPFRELTMAGFVALLVAALLVAAVLVALASLLVLRAGLAPRWVASSGFVVAALALAGPGWAPQFLVPLWVLLVGLTVRPSPDHFEGTTAAAGPMAVGR